MDEFKACFLYAITALIAVLAVKDMSGANVLKEIKNELASIRKLMEDEGRTAHERER